MKLVVSSRADAAADVLQAHVDFHLGAGADVVLLHGSEVPADIAAHARVQTVGPGTAALLAALEAAEPDWLIEGEAREFWWPRGGSLKELLSPLSQRFASVRVLPRDFVAV